MAEWRAGRGESYEIEGARKKAMGREKRRRAASIYVASIKAGYTKIAAIREVAVCMGVTTERARRWMNKTKRAAA